MAEPTLYQILMVDPGADMGIITVVYHALAKRYHPDRTDVRDVGQRMSAINGAYSILSVPSSRELYDRSIGLTSSWSGASKRVAIPIETAGPSASTTTAASDASPYGEAGPPPPYPLPSGSVLTFGRYKGWAMSQIEGFDPNYLDWLRRTPTGRMYTAEIDAYMRLRVSA